MDDRPQSLAVSNFSPSQLDAVLSVGGATVPTVNQLPYGVGFAGQYNGGMAAIVAENTKRGVVVQAWSPLQRALRGNRRAACEEGTPSVLPQPSLACTAAPSLRSRAILARVTILPQPSSI